MFEVLPCHDYDDSAYRGRIGLFGGWMGHERLDYGSYILPSTESEVQDATWKVSAPKNTHDNVIRPEGKLGPL